MSTPCSCAASRAQGEPRRLSRAWRARHHHLVKPPQSTSQRGSSSQSSSRSPTAPSTIVSPTRTRHHPESRLDQFLASLFSGDDPARAQPRSGSCAPTDRTGSAPPADRPSAESPRPHKPRTDLAHIVIKDRLPTRIAQVGGDLPQPLRLDRRVGLQLLADPLPKRIQLRARQRARTTSAASTPPAPDGSSCDATPSAS